MNFVISMELVLYIIMFYRGRRVKRDVSRVSPFSSQIVLVCVGEVFPGTLGPLGLVRTHDRVRLLGRFHKGPLSRRNKKTFWRME
ncbi:Dihydroxy-acid dehydratase 1 [Frankliniella fusca]|uniref:Dihydroxy-acid dehydratase 1 n=1 Tax=Frankliniella fusca TaxID=407009 RepID=A0AAE1LA78_9NEOP|nr:Dihydroxy-acid dehydratase 1 [Frankliniella fusca]